VLHQPDRYPRSAAYDPEWLLNLDMGPNPLWLLEDLCRDLDLRPGMRILDLGSGLGATSVFLAREFGAEVVAADLWVAPEKAAQVFAEAGVADRVRAVRAEAHTLPFDAESFDAIVCIDAYEYFGTADNYLPYLVGLLRPGGRLGVATPAMRREVRDLGAVPPHIKACVGWEAIAWHTAEWWRFQWEITELVTVTAARLQEHGCDDWLRWARAGLARTGSTTNESVVAMLEADRGELLTFALLSAVKAGPR
jgi:cyclopropane fatty-acyl-phospholipid synthase-like methyltransferase